MRELVGSMGMCAPSVYNAFGDKQRLFARALELYLDCNARDLVNRLESSLPPKKAVQRFFAEIVDHSINDREHRGCFLVNSALEVTPHQKELGAVIAKQFGEIEAFFKRCIIRAQADGSTPRAVDANNTARLLLGVILGIRVLARSSPNRTLLEGMMKQTLALLNFPSRKRTKTR